MNPDRLKTVKSIVDSAISLPPAEREGFLAQVCSSDPSLRPEIDAFMARYEPPSATTATGNATMTAMGEAVRPADAGRGYAFTAGDVLAERFRIVRFIGKGGMGEVYEAEDLALNEHIALKTVRPEITADPRMIARFKREIQLARKITHPNVCRLFDLFQHNRVTFLTMELLRGETLAHRLARMPRMTTGEAQPAVEQMAAALEAAHHAGIVHGDFKSANVILISVKGGGTRAVVTDFGLARRALEHDGRTVTARTEQPFGGTPAYMAPEQMEGGEITPAADIYALGTVMYEMVSGSRPFSGPTPMDAVLKRLSEPAPSPRKYVRDLDPVWETVILRCLERKPQDRYAHVGEVVAALRGAGADVAEPRSGARISRFWAGAVIALAVVAALCAWLFWPHKPLEERAGLAAAPPRRSIAVLGFRNASGRPDTAWLSTALGEMLMTELAAGEKLRTIPGESVARARIELRLADVDSLAPDTLARLRKNLGADLVVAGSYMDLPAGSGSRLRFDLRVQDAATGDIVASVAQSGNQADLFDLVSRTGASLRARLGAGAMTAEGAKEVRGALPRKADAARWYAEGLARLRNFDGPGARDSLQKAIAADPDYPLAYRALAAAWTALGYDAEAKKAAEKAFHLSAGRPREERLSIEGLYRETSGDWVRAVEIYRTLFGFFSDDLEYGLRLANAQTSAGQGKAALETIAALRKLPPPSRGDPRIDLQEAWAAQSQSDYKRANAAARHAAVAGQARGATLIAARARLAEATTLRHLGDLRAAITASESARSLFDSAGDQAGVAGALNNVANCLSDLGDLGAARSMYEQSLDIYTKVENKSGMAGALDNIANVLVDQGEPAAARKLSERALALYTEIDQKNGIADTLNNIGGELALEGDLSGAKAIYEKTLAMRRAIGDRGGVGVTWNNMGDMLLGLGQISAAKVAYSEAIKAFQETGQKASVAYPLFGLGQTLAAAGESAEATKKMEQALAACRETGDRHETAYALSGLADLELRRGDLAAARKRHAEALGIRTELGEKGSAAESWIGLAAVALEEGRPAEAERHARDAAGEFHRERQSDGEGLARTWLTLALVAQQNKTAARQEISKAATLLGRSQNRAIRLRHAISAARVRAASGTQADMRESIAALNTVLAEAAGLHLMPELFEARLALLQIEAGQDSATNRIETLEREARQQEFLLIAAKARDLRKAKTQSTGELR